MLSERELFVSAVTASIIAPISKEITEEARLIILKHIRDSKCPNISDQEWVDIYKEVMAKKKIFEDSSMHGIVAHINGVRLNTGKIIKEAKQAEKSKTLEKMSHVLQDKAVKSPSTEIQPTSDKIETSPLSGLFRKFQKDEIKQDETTAEKV